MTSPTPTFAGASVVTHADWSPALQLAASFEQNHPGSPFHLLALETPPPHIRLPDNLLVTWTADLNLPDFHSTAMRYQPEELVARLKPHFLLQLLGQYEQVVYLAPQIQVCHPLHSTLARLQSANIVLAPRYHRPFADVLPGEEVEALMAGHYHSGFLAIRRSPTSQNFLRWLEDRCRELAFDEPSQGLSLDQKWLNLAPCLFDGVTVDRSPNLLIGAWNLQNRTLSQTGGSWFVDNQPATLVFKQTRPDPDSAAPSLLPEPFQLDPFVRPDSTHSVFSTFADGSPISAVARKVFAISEFHSTGENPFAAGSKFERFCQKHQLIGPGSPRLRPEPLKENDFLAQVIRWGFYAVLRIFGAPLYEMLLKYLRYLASVRNQHEVFFKNKSLERSGLDPRVYVRIRE